VVHFCILYFNVCEVPPARLPVDHIATYCQKSAQQIWMCASYTVGVSFPTPPHTTIMCIVSYIQSRSIWHAEIVFPELSSFHEVFVFVLFCLFCFKYVLFIVVRIFIPCLPCLSNHKNHIQPSKIPWSMSLHQCKKKKKQMKI